jgi:TRAP-type C4-dicarboxylate transport system permease small subunit
VCRSNHPGGALEGEKMNLKRFNQVAETGENILAGVAMVVLSLIIFSVCLEIIMRYFLNRPLVWVVELTEYGLLYVTFLGAAWLLRQGGHVQVDIIVDFLNNRWRKRCAVFSSAMGLAVSLLLTVFGAIATYDHLVRGIYKPTVLEFPTGVVLVAVPLGSLFLSARFLILMLDQLILLKQDPPGQRKEI